MRLAGQLPRERVASAYCAECYARYRLNKPRGLCTAHGRAPLIGEARDARKVVSQ